MLGSREPTLYTFLDCFPWKAHQWLTLGDLEACRSLEMCTPLKARQHVCLTKLHHVCVICWMLYESLSKLWIAPLSLTRRCAIAHTKLCIIVFGLYLSFGMHHGSDKHLACGDGTNLNGCEVMAITVDYDMTIITLESLYSVLSCRHTTPDALFVQYG
jgi:hypothetical protein